MENKTDFLEEDRIGEIMNDSRLLCQARQVALDQIVCALKSVILLQKMSDKLSAPNTGNIHIAKEDIMDAIVNLAIVRAAGNHQRTRKILADYGLEGLI